MSKLPMRRTAESTLLGLSVGVIAATAASLALFATRIAFGGPSVFEIVSEGVVQLLPGALFSAALDQLRFTGKPVLFTIVQIASLVVGALLGLYYMKRCGEQQPESPSTWLASPNKQDAPITDRAQPFEANAERQYPVTNSLIFGGALYLLLGTLVLPLMGTGVFGLSRTSDVPLWIATLIAVVTFTVVASVASSYASTLLADSFSKATTNAGAHISTSMVQRRTALNALAGGAVLAIGSVFAWSSLRTAPATGVEGTNPSGASTSGGGLSPGQQPEGRHPTTEVTRVGTFYNVSKNFIDPVVTDTNWKVQFVGHVTNPLSFGLDDLRAMPTVDRQHTLCCISNEVGGDLIGNGQWRGVRFGDLLEQAGIKPGAQKVVFHCRDDYRDSITIEAARNPDTLFAYEMNGSPLTNKHGFPARLLIPGIYGMKNVKWLDKVEILPSPFLGFWQSQGWSDPAPYLTMSRIDWPTRAGLRFQPVSTTLYGVAYAGDRGIAQVEITVDGGAVWQPAKIITGGQPNVWARWAFDWTPEAGRQSSVKVRATDGKGQKQIETAHEPFPDGATGYHSLTIAVANA